MKLFFLLCFFIVLQMSGLTPDRVILATDANRDYIEFWPVVAKAWKEVVGLTPTLALIADKDVQIDQSLGQVIRFEPIEGIPTSLQAQTIRLLLPALFEDDVCIISDIDMIPLQKDYFFDSIYHCAQDTFVVYRDKAYHPNEHKFPMCYMAARGKTFQDIFGISNRDDIERRILDWHNLDLGWNTDELLLYQYLMNWQHKDTRLIKLGHNVERRIDRSCWIYDPEFLAKKAYIDAHCPRPYSAFKDPIDMVIRTVGARINKRVLNKGAGGTYMAPLLTIAAHTDGPILEMGSSDFCTPLLHAVCSATKRQLYSTSTAQKSLNNFVDLETDWHKFEYVSVYEDDWVLNPKPERWNEVGNGLHWSIVLIDHRPGERRVKDIERLRANTDVFVVHDTQQPAYGYESILNTFKYKYVYDRYVTETTIVSDTIDVATFFEE